MGHRAPEPRYLVAGSSFPPDPGDGKGQRADTHVPLRVHPPGALTWAPPGKAMGMGRAMLPCCHPTASASLPIPQGEAPSRVPGAEGEYPRTPGWFCLPPPLPEIPATVRGRGAARRGSAARPPLMAPVPAATPSSPPRRGRAGAGTSGKACSTCCAPSTWTQTSTRWDGARCSSRTPSR